MDIRPFVPSLAYRMCMAASGAFDFAVAGANSHDWDIAAADLVLEEAAGGWSRRPESGCDTTSRALAAASLLGAPDALAPQLLEAFRAATGA